MRHLQTGLTLFDERRATPGYTLFSPLGRKTTYLVDMQGKVVHEWHLPGYVGIYGYLLQNSNLLAAVQTDDGPVGLRGTGGHLVELDWDSNIVWQYIDHHHHHDQRRCANGNTLYASSRLLPADLAARVPGGQAGTELPVGIYGDVLREIDPSGNIIWEWDAATCEQMYEYPLNPMCSRVEFSHANAVVPLDNGDVLVNFRYNHLMAIIDRQSKAFKWTLCDWSFGQQHNVHMLENGNLLFFANGSNVLYGGPTAGSRVIELDPVTQDIVWEYKGSPTPTFFSWFISGAQRLSTGNTLICEGAWGRLFEVTPEGDIVWEFINPFFAEDHPAYKDHNYVFRGYRYAAVSLEIAGRLNYMPA
ncbi:aryl-sulfate sulfotransferase [Alphaproteobacteria bacterium]|nr:aryl-sulfate sulfotransferase [Alphaproteobacteria bacterium]